MAGVKGRSGRRTTSEGEKRRKTIQKAWEVMAHVMETALRKIEVGAKLTYSDIQIAKEIALKDLSRMVSMEHKGEIVHTDKKIIIVYEGKNENQNTQNSSLGAERNIGLPRALQDS
jgi:hypothetical protein